MGRINVSCGLNFCTINITGKQIVFLRMILILYSHLFIGANLGAIHLSDVIVFWMKDDRRLARDEYFLCVMYVFYP